MRHLATGFGACILLLVSTPAAALDLCEVRIVRPVQDDMGNRLKVGDIRPTTVPDIDKKTGAVSFCAHGGSCIPEFIANGGRKVRAAVLQKCRLDLKTQDYAFDTTQIPASKIAQNKLESAMSGLGMSFAAAADVSSAVAADPGSQRSTRIWLALKRARADMAVLDPAGEQNTK